MDLDKQLTFDNFIFSYANRFIEDILNRFVDSPESVALFLSGDEGTGKTHLLHAVGNRAMEIDPAIRLHFLRGGIF